MYEGYGPHGVALMAHVVTDNRNRSVSEVRHLFNRSGGSLGELGCVAWQFRSQGYITVVPGDYDPLELFEWAAEAGAEDVTIGDDLIEVTTSAEDFGAVRSALMARGVKPESAELSWIPSSAISLEPKQAFQNMNLINNLEELEDVAQVYSNLDITDELIELFDQQ
jgi:YebC/PmpR family DNA-binding regulatory protein